MQQVEALVVRGCEGLVVASKHTGDQLAARSASRLRGAPDVCEARDAPRVAVDAHPRAATEPVDGAEHLATLFERTGLARQELIAVVSEHEREVWVRIQRHAHDAHAASLSWLTKA